MPVYTPKPGFEWNPLRRYPNLPCPCASNKKAKRCHGAHGIIPAEDAVRVRAYLRELSAQGFIQARRSHIRPESDTP